jgi:hypothetical protein
VRKVGRSSTHISHEVRQHGGSFSGQLPTVSVHGARHTASQPPHPAAQPTARWWHTHTRRRTPVPAAPPHAAHASPLLATRRSLRRCMGAGREGGRAGDDALLQSGFRRIQRHIQPDHPPTRTVQHRLPRSPPRGCYEYVALRPFRARPITLTTLSLRALVHSVEA